ncbi:alpha-1,2-fucosyltransferase [Rhodopirellula sp. JC639]|uniref:alpha-1,2-fucosyltransferase n=1 Tax=Stieleria mannarensis TaxID=2755585 RepID=UPI0015FECBD7|nr:alpha-1,2-fucosyltransferase [Rhodopirellula sp. JC639]
MMILSRRYGQLGNRLILYSNLIAAARHYRIELRNPSFAEYASLFPSTREDLWCRYDAHLKPSPNHRPSRRPPSRRRRNALMHVMQAVAKSMNAIGMRHYPAKVIRLGAGEICDLEGDRFRSAVESGRTLLLQGWLFRSPRLLEQHWPHIRDFFTVSKTDRDVIDQRIRQARRDSDVLVGVHIRRGDYANYRGGQYYYDDALYSRWMHSVCDQLPGQRVRFLVCSNEPLDESAFTGLNITHGPGTALRDMYALADTDWMMGPPSTFTGWAEMVGRRPRIELQSRQQSVVVPPSVVSQSLAFQPNAEQVAA